MTLVMEEDILIHGIKEDTEAFDKLGRELMSIQGAMDAISAYGINPTSLHILKSSNLLTTASYQQIALESFPTEKEGGLESVKALEVLSDSFKEKAAQYSAKILSITTQAASKMWTIVEQIGSKISALIKDMGDKAREETKAVGREVKAHPVKTCVAVLAAVASVAAIMIYSASNLPGAGQSREVYKLFTSKINGMINKIPNPFGKVASMVDDASRFRVDVVFPARAASSIPVEKLGWNYHAAKAIGVHVNKTLASLKTGFNMFGSKLYSGAQSAAKTAFKTAESVKSSVPRHVYNLTGSSEAAHAASFAAGGIYFGMLISLAYAIWRLVKTIVVGGLRLVYSSIKNVFS
jgi:gas vesicle protein